MKCISPLIRLPIFLVILLNLSSCGSSPSKSTSNTTNSGKTNLHFELCSSLANVAETVMKARQEGVQMEQLIKANEEYSGKPTSFDKIFHDFTEMSILEAYKYPRYSSQASQQEAIREFRSKQFTFCYSALTS